MNRDEFWTLIDRARRGRETDEVPEALVEALAERSPAEIIEFQRHLDELMAASYSWELWGAAYLIHGGCSDDGFDYFRGWLIAQGRSVFERALADPESLASLPALEEDVECEGMLYVAQSAHESATGEGMPAMPVQLPELGEGWDFDDDGEMRSRYPELYEKFCA